MDIQLMPGIMLKLSDIEPNKGQIDGLPKNPRFIKDDKFKKLVKSIEDNPEMTAMREILVYPMPNGKYVIIGGNMRYRAMKELKYKEAPCKVIPQEATTEQLKAYTLKDNSGYGEWDFDLLNNEWDLSMLEDCAIDLPEKVLFREKSDDNDAEDDFDLDIDLGEIEEDEEDEKRSIIELMVSDRVYPTNNPFDIPVLRKDAQPINGLELPFGVWGADSRLRKDIKTYCFYVEDYRFEAIWKDPSVVVKSGVNAIVEPNLSLYDTTPIAYGLQQIYKKRWIARYFQECGILVYADLNVSQKFYDYNRLGIPDGYNAFATRGYNDRIEYLIQEIEIAKQISGMEHPNMIVYGGGAKIKEVCDRYQIIYVEQFMQSHGRK
jgi:hypothetical protein